MTKPSCLKLALPPILAAIMLCGCAQQKAEVSEKKASNEVAAIFHVDPATAGTVRGRVLYHGPRPERKRISMYGDPACVKAAKGPAYQDKLLVSREGGVANAFVYVKAGLEGKKFETPAEPMVLDQKGCVFGPRVMGAQVKQTVLIRNGDPLEHNIHPMPKNNMGWNEAMAPGVPDVPHRFAHPEVMIRVKCNVHGWMRAYLGVLEHPYYAVTGPDGSFELKNVPPGDYTIGVWHEELGETEKPANLTPGGSQQVEFVFEK
jgi:hypothetical protein